MERLMQINNHDAALAAGLLHRFVEIHESGDCGQCLTDEQVAEANRLVELLDPPQVFREERVAADLRSRLARR